MYLYVLRVRGSGCSVDQSGARTGDWSSTGGEIQFSMKLLYELLEHVHRMLSMGDESSEDISFCEGDMKGILYTHNVRTSIDVYFGMRFVAEIYDSEGAWIQIDFLANAWDGVEDVPLAALWLEETADRPLTADA